MKNIKFLIFTAILLFNGQFLYAELDGLITEIYAKGTSDGEPADWMEIYCLDSGSVAGSKIYHAYTDTGTRVITLPSITVEEGDYIVVHFSDDSTADETNVTGDTNGNGVWDVYTDYENSSSWGISLSKGACWITKTDGSTWEDFVIYIDATASFPDDFSSIYSTAASKSQWGPDNSGSWTEDDYRDYSVDTEERDTGISLQRITATSGDPADTDTVLDWEMGPTSEGAGYYTAQESEDRLKVSDSPFFPHEDNDGQPTAGRVSFNLDSSNYTVTLAIYDVNGYAKRYLLRDEALASANGTISWNGYDENGDIVPVGIYIVHLKAEENDTGKIKTAQDSIIVGRKF